MYKTIEVEIDAADIFNELTDEDLLDECSRRKLKSVAPIELADDLLRLQDLILRNRRSESISLVDFIVSAICHRSHDASSAYHAAKSGKHSFLRVAQ